MRVYLHTFGCKANQYDTEVVRQALEGAGARVVADPRAADAAVVNSCTVTHVSEAKMRGLVRRLARLRPGLRTVVMGCAAALDDGSIAGLAEVDAVVGGADAQGVLRALGLPAPVVDGPLRRFERGARAWLRIQDGCDEHCTFCATTIARGPNRSRRVDDVVREARLLGRTAAEIVLTGIHIGTFGRDGGAADLGRLVEHLVRDVPDVRFRLSSIEATEVTERLARLIVERPERVAPHLHAPLQSGSDRVLRRMGRHWYTAAEYAARVEALAARLPRMALGADLMVGFPGETASDHRQTVDLVGRLPFTYLHVFPYSERPGASAQRLGRPVPPEVAAERSAELREVGRAKGEAYRGRRRGDADVVVLGRIRGRFEGLTEDYLTVGLAADGPVGRRVQATIERGDDGRLWARPRLPQVA